MSDTVVLDGEFGLYMDTGLGSITVDSALSDSSTNPVQNMIIKGALDEKADASDVYTKTEVDTALSAKADTSTTYTKTETDALLADKADSSTTYTKTEVDTALADKQDAMPLTSDSTASVTLSAEWNHKYVYDSTLTDLTVTIPTAPTTYNAEIVIVVNPCGATAPVITLPNTVVLDGDSATADEYYEISISNELVAFARSVSLT